MRQVYNSRAVHISRHNGVRRELFHIKHSSRSISDRRHFHLLQKQQCVEENVRLFPSPFFSLLGDIGDQRHQSKTFAHKQKAFLRIIWSHDSQRVRHTCGSTPCFSFDLDQPSSVSKYEVSSERSTISDSESFIDQLVQHVSLSMLQCQHLLHSDLHRRQPDVSPILCAVEPRTATIHSSECQFKRLLV